MKFNLFAALWLAFLSCRYHSEAMHNTNNNDLKQRYHHLYTQTLHQVSPSKPPSKIDQPSRLLQLSKRIFNTPRGGGGGWSSKDSIKRNGLQLIIKEEHDGNKDENRDDIENNVCSYISHVLNKRYSQVMNEERSNHFANHYSKRVDIDGIVSGHGRDQQDQNGLIKFEEIYMINDNDDKKPSSCFPSDILSLDMVFTQPMYNTAQEEIKQRKVIELSDTSDMYEKEKLFVPRLLLRAAHLGFNFTPVTLTMGLAVISKSFRENVWYNLVGKCLAKSGPAFIKWGQWASTRSDMFPGALCRALSELHADAPAHNWKITQKTVEEALCIPKDTLLEVFEEFDEKPVASGSIAQIHRAVLRRSADDEKESKSSGKHNKKSKGKKCYSTEKEKKSIVAIKVRHPNVSRLINMDFRLMSIVADVADRLPSLSWLRVRDSIEQFSHTMAAQAHLHVEAHHLEVLNYNFRHWDAVKFPSPLFACSSVIIETYEKGEICTSLIDKYDSLANNQHFQESPIVIEVGNEVHSGANEGSEGGHKLMPVRLSKFIITTGLSLYLKMLLVDNLMHADLHPGNIMLDCQIIGEKYGDMSPLSSLGDVPVGGASSNCETVAKLARRVESPRKDVSKAAKAPGGFYGQVTLVDAGMVAQLDDDESANFIGLISALGEGDGRAAAEALMNFNNDNKLEENDPNLKVLTGEEREAFVQDIIILFKERCQGYGTNVEFGDVLRGILGIVKKHKIQMGANYATLVVNALCMDSLAKRVCPSYNLLDASKPMLRAYQKTGFLSKRTELRRFVMRAATPILYMRKKSKDNEFFREIEMRRSGRKVPGRKITPIQILISPVVCLVKTVNGICSNKSYRRALSCGITALLAHHAASILIANEEKHPKSKQDETPTRRYWYQ